MISYVQLCAPEKAGTQNIQSSRRTFDTFGRESEQPPSGCIWPPRRVVFFASCLARPQSERSGHVSTKK